MEDVIRRADIALFNAKKEGKNRIEFYNEGIDGTSTKRLDLEKYMRKATMNECDEFTVYFQPIINVKGEDVCAGAEALVRWNSATMGFINPVDFIPLAEYLGLINDRERCIKRGGEALTGTGMTWDILTTRST